MSTDNTTFATTTAPNTTTTTITIRFDRVYRCHVVILVVIVIVIVIVIMIMIMIVIVTDGSTFTCEPNNLRLALSLSFYYVHSLIESSGVAKGGETGRYERQRESRGMMIMEVGGEEEPKFVNS